MPRLDRRIQRGAPIGSSTTASGILDRPVKPGDDSGIGSYAAFAFASRIARQIFSGVSGMLRCLMP